MRGMSSRGMSSYPPFSAAEVHRKAGTWLDDREIYE